ncbi:conserved oligomeric Golgi complex subunit 7-like [Mytilus californianus]|uniref:conserved oligomeric Golgi complex subunit 7-like n=1 Tax=Mytilus californianus TaxID=6549 RepID=UPI00224713E1|nr:conserved oligomeric Golgi complex subunit 7-like [Mytilus californianus]
MDYSKFLEDNFDVKEWVNNAFRTPKEPNVSKDQYATTLVMKLQMFIQEVNNVIEEASQQAIQNLPRVMRELDAVKQEASLLQDQMKSVKHDIQKVEHDTAQSMQMLLKLDVIKSRMSSAAEALQEADNWTTLSTDVEDVFHSQDVADITTKLSRMQNCLQMLVDTPDYADRCQHLEKLKNRLEAMLSPQLISAFNNQSIEAARNYTKMFADIDRLPQLYKYYHKCHKTSLLADWKDLIQSKGDNTLKEWLTEYYDQLLSTWHVQMKWCQQVFSDPLPIVCELITETLATLDPPLASCFATYLQGKEPLLALIEIKQITDRFSHSLEQAVDAAMDSNISEHFSSMEKMLMSIYAPYRGYIAKYKSLEEISLANSLNKIALDHEDVFETVQLLAASVNKLFAVAKDADDRCQQLTNGTGYCFLLTSLQSYFQSYCKEFRRVLTNIKEKSKTTQFTEEDEEWANFQQSLRIIQTCGELIMHLDDLDTVIISSILHTIGKYVVPLTPEKEISRHRFWGTHSSLQSHASLLLSSRVDLDDLEQFVINLEKGETPSVVSEIKKDFCKLSEEVHKFAFEIVFGPLKRYLVDLSAMEMWTSRSAGGALTSDLPTFSLSPQEYITKIGQYMMTLPQHLEPFTMQDNPAVLVALKHGRLPYTDETDVPEHTADLWLESIARGTMHFYAEEILKIHELSPHATKQLITDIDYLCNVLDDLGLRASDNIIHIEELLKATPDDYPDVSEQMPQRMAHAISSMRNIDL